MDPDEEFLNIVLFMFLFHKVCFAEKMLVDLINMNFKKVQKCICIFMSSSKVRAKNTV